MADYLSPTPYANPLTGLSNDMIQGLLGYMKDKQRTQQLQGLAGLLESTGIPQTVERAAYADSPKALLDALTNVNRANVPLLKAETADALMNVAPFVGPAAKGAERAAMAAGRAGERYAEKVVPQIMERGGLPAQLLGDLAQGSRRQIFVPASLDEALKASKLLKTKSPEEVWEETGIGKYAGEYVKEISDKSAKFNTADEIAADAQKIRERNAELKQTIKESQSTYPDLFPKELTAARRPLREEIKTNQGLLERNYGYESDPKWMGNFAQLAYEHPELYKTIPELKNVVVRQGRDDPSFLGSYQRLPHLDVGSVDVTKSGLLRDPRSTATHEMQHAVSDLSGWQAGGAPEMFQQQEAAKLTKDALSWNKEIENASKRYPNEDRSFLESVVVDDYVKNKVGDWIPSIEARDMARLFAKYPEQANEAQNLVKVYGLDKKVTPNSPDKVYKNLEGEALARLAQTRIDLDEAQRLKNYPFVQQTESYKYGLDVNPDDLIYRDTVEGLLGQSKAASAFDVSRRDASEIFGAGAERVMYKDPKSGGTMEVLAKPDGTASVLSLEVPETSRGKGIGQSLQAQVMQDFPEMMGQVSSKAAAKTAYRLGRRPPFNPDATLDDVYKMMDEDSSVNLVSPEMQKRFRQSLLD